MPASSHDVVLTCHPATRSGAVHSVGVRVSKTSDSVLALTYTLEGDLERLCVPASRTPTFADLLWEHTCCEAFVARKGEHAYHEFNFSPSAQWAVFAFERYRERAPPVREADAGGLNPRIVVRGGANKLELDATIQLDRMSPAHSATALSLALSTVIEDRDGVISYWALKHAPGEADFHHPDSFALQLPD